MNAYRACTLALLTGALLGAEPTIPPAVSKEIDAFRSRIAKIDQEAEKDRREELAKVVKYLDDNLKAETKKGNLDGAIEIRKLRDSLQNAAKQTTSMDLLGEEGLAAKPESLILGNWKMANGTGWVIKPGGVFIRHRPDGSDSPGSWKTVDGKIVFVYESGRELPLVRVDRKQLVVLREGVELVCEREAAESRIPAR